MRLLTKVLSSTSLIGRGRKTFFPKVQLGPLASWTGKLIR